MHDLPPAFGFLDVIRRSSLIGLGNITLDAHKFQQLLLTLMLECPTDIRDLSGMTNDQNQGSGKSFLIWTTDQDKLPLGPHAASTDINKRCHFKISQGG